MALRAGLWPWTDFAAPYAVVHVVNESDGVVRAGWRWADSDHWNGVRPSDRNPDGVSAHSTEFELIVLLPREILERPIEADLDLSPGFTRGVVLRVDGTDFGTVEHAVTLGLHDHVQLRITADNRVVFAAGGESWIGYPAYSSETELVAR